MVQHNTIPCTVAGCTRLAWARTLCRVHYNKWRNLHGAKPCSMEGCSFRSYARGYCSMHYARIEAHGDPTTVAPFRRPREDVHTHFWRQVLKTETCWLWTGYVNKGGYGVFHYGADVRTLAHRFSWEEEHGPWPADKVGMHSCDIRNCIRPAHVTPGTHKENSEDMVQRGRSLRGDRNPAKTSPNIRKGDQHPHHKLTDAQVRDVSTLSRYIRGAEIARMFEVHPTTIYRIINGKGWTHLDELSNRETPLLR